VTGLKKAIVGIGLMISGTVGVSTQRIVDTIFTANDWQLAHGGPNLLYGLSALALAGGVILCILALKDTDR